MDEATPPYGCTRRWAELARIEGSAESRFCGDCGKAVHWAGSIDEARSLGSQGLCMAFKVTADFGAMYVGFEAPGASMLDDLLASGPRSPRPPDA